MTPRWGAKDQVLVTGRMAYVFDGTNAYPLKGDASGYTLQRHGLTTVGDGTKACGTAGVRIQLSGTSTVIQAVVVTAKLSNTSTVVIGGATVIASTATQRGTPLNAGDSVTIYTDNLTDIYLDALTTGEAVVYTYMA